MNQISVCVIACFGVVGCASVPREQTAGAYKVVQPDLPRFELTALVERVSQIQVGMRREDAEKILQVLHDRYGAMTTIQGGAQGVRYTLADGYSVTVFYDYTGIARGPNGVPLREIYSPDNRVIAAAVLNRPLGEKRKSPTRRQSQRPQAAVAHLER